MEGLTDTSVFIHVFGYRVSKPGSGLLASPEGGFQVLLPLNKGLNETRKQWKGLPNKVKVDSGRETGSAERAWPQ